jgi:peptidoglycan/LPS O-acetylase OafA/YrhL
VRLIAAGQVVLVHFISLIPGLRNDEWLRALSILPGVPIFFFISGWLITGSWLRQPNVATYVASRALRIFPALWLSCLFTLLMLAIFHTGPLFDNLGSAFVWSLMQMSVLQAWNPEFLRGYATGVANPALWTIAVELVFYVTLPLLVIMGQRLGRLRGVLFAAGIASFIVFTFVFGDIADPSQASFAHKLLIVSPASFVTWLWMFVVGALAQVESARIVKLVAHRFAWFAGLALLVGVLSLVIDVPPWLHLPGNELGLLNALTLGAAALSLAYSYPGLAQRWLRGHDLSYGTYLFHMPVANALIAAGIVAWPAAIAAGVGTFVAALASWILVERRALRHKRDVATLLSRRPVFIKAWAAR